MIRILLVDDHAMFREGLKQILGQHPDMKVEGEAGNASEALTKIREHHFDVILLDISLPGQSGLDILNEIRSERPEQVVLILSMHPEDQYAIRMLKAGAAGYITKESAADKLVSALRRVASGGKYITAELAERLASELEGKTATSPHQLLSNREFQVFCSIASGNKLVEIAHEMNLSIKSVSTYRRRVLQKMGMQTNADVTGYAVEYKLI